jgi:putative ABC transport system permease protein
MIKIIRHAFALIREDKLFSAIYIAGTAVAIASAMVIAIVLNIKIADIPPESNRSRTLYVINGFVTDSAKANNSGSQFGVSTAAIDSTFRKMECVEAVTGVTYAQLIVGDDEEKKTMNAFAIGCDPDFFRIYDLTFIDGRPFSEKEFRGGEPVCVISDKVAKQLGNTTHIVLDRINKRLSLRIVGVVKAVSGLMENTAADLYVPYKLEGDVFFKPDQQIEGISYSGHLVVQVMLQKGFSRKDFLEELEPMRQHYNAVVSSQLGENTEWVVSATSHFFKNLNFFGEIDAEGFKDQAKNLMVPALLMLLFLFLPAINLSGLVSNRMEARRAEMGIRKAFGAKRRTLLNEVIHENLVLTLCGGLVGWVLSGLFINAVANSEVMKNIFRGNGHYDPSFDFQMFFTPTLFLIAFVCCALLNLMAALIPAWRSLRKPIVESLNQKR